jgi:hypothetical protein
MSNTFSNLSQFFGNAKERFEPIGCFSAKHMRRWQKQLCGLLTGDDG